MRSAGPFHSAGGRGSTICLLHKVRGMVGEEVLPVG